jgi:hypothetical protein
LCPVCPCLLDLLQISLTADADAVCGFVKSSCRIYQRAEREQLPTDKDGSCLPACQLADGTSLSCVLNSLVERNLIPSSLSEPS